jgi:UDP:flavonoid glycosyltransferase YjiC (YdhE family)
MTKHLFVDISSHGFGHLGQAAPVLTALLKRLPDLHLTVRCGLPRRILAARLPEGFVHIEEASDFGYVMKDAVSVDREASRIAYRQAHADFAGRVQREAEFLRSLRPDLVLTDVAYLPLAGAKTAGIPAIAMSSLNWLDLARHFYGEEAWAAPIIADMQAAYADAEMFIQLTPAMPMETLPNRRVVGPVARVASPDARLRLRKTLGVEEGQTLVLVAMGGFDMDLPTDRWPTYPALRYLMPAAWDCDHPNAIAYTQGEFDFTELLRAADAVLTKPGYGTVVEAACNGVPMLYLRRNDWPEQEPLMTWLHQVGRCVEVKREDLDSGTWTRKLDTLLAESNPIPAMPTGIEEAVSILAACL